MSLCSARIKIQARICVALNMLTNVIPRVIIGLFHNNVWADVHDLYSTLCQ